MLEDDGVSARLHVDRPLIRLDVDREDWREAAMVLEAEGGRPISQAEGAVYGFLTRQARDQALERVRGRFGWTIADPFEGRP